MQIGRKITAICKKQHTIKKAGMTLKKGEKCILSQIDGEYFLGAAVFDLVKFTKEDMEEYFEPLPSPKEK